MNINDIQGKTPREQIMKLQMNNALCDIAILRYTKIKTLKLTQKHKHERTQGNIKN